MEQPLEIAFHNMESSPELEADIRAHAERLSKLYDRLTAVNVTVEGGAHPEHRVGNLYRVHILMEVPGDHNLVVTHEPHHVREHYAHPDAESGIRSAFHAAERQLKDYKSRRRTESGQRD